MYITLYIIVHAFNDEIADVLFPIIVFRVWTFPVAFPVDKKDVEKEEVRTYDVKEE